MKDKTFAALSGIFFLLFFIGIGAVTLNKPITTLLHAKNVNPSPLKSFGVVFPQVGKAGSETGTSKPTKIRVNVFIRDVSGAVLSNRSVKLSSDLPAVTITPSDTQMTNNIGSAEFFITAASPGKTLLTAVDTESNTVVKNIPSVEFTQ
jgi:hypothetical protein